MLKAAAQWYEQGIAVVGCCQQLLPGLVGVYVHGSAALGGMTKTSDLDILVITRSEAGATDLGPALLSTAGRPRDIELSVVISTAAERPQRPWPFVLHVNSGEGRFQLGSTSGDPDLVAHYAVTRAAGIALFGPESSLVVGKIDPDQLLCYLRSELQWGLDHGDERYAVLNACRATAYRATGRLLSKVDGAIWWVETHGVSEIVSRAQQAQQAGVDVGPAAPDARVFVTDQIAQLHP